MSRPTKQQAERRATVKSALVEAGGDLNVSALARQLGVSRDTIYNDLRLIDEQAAVEDPTVEDRRATILAQLLGIVEDSLARVEDTSLQRNHNARVGYYRVAMTAIDKLAALEGYNAPQRHAHEGQVTHEHIQRVETLKVVKTYDDNHLPPGEVVN